MIDVGLVGGGSLDRKAQDEGEDWDQDHLEISLVFPSSLLSITYFSDPTLTLESWRERCIQITEYFGIIKNYQDK